MANVMVLELGIAAALVVLSTAAGLRVVAALVVLSALAIGVIRWHGRWVPQWLVVIGRFLARKRSKVASPAPSVAEPAETASGAASTVTGPEDARVSLLRLLVDDLVVVNTTTRDQQPIGLAWHKGHGRQHCSSIQCLPWCHRLARAPMSRWPHSPTASKTVESCSTPSASSGTATRAARGCLSARRRSPHTTRCSARCPRWRNGPPG